MSNLVVHANFVLALLRYASLRRRRESARTVGSDNVTGFRNMNLCRTHVAKNDSGVAAVSLSPALLTDSKVILFAHRQRLTCARLLGINMRSTSHKVQAREL